MIRKQACPLIPVYSKCVSSGSSLPCSVWVIGVGISVGVIGVIISVWVIGVRIVRCIGVYYYGVYYYNTLLLSLQLVSGCARSMGLCRCVAVCWCGQ